MSLRVEVDRLLVEVLQKELGDFANVEIVHTDVLQFDFSSVCTGPMPEGRKERIKVIGNVPYNLSSQIVLRLLEYRDCLDRVVLMLQREVAERLAAPPGTKDYGPLSVYVALFTEPTLENKVPAGCFYPRPDVESRVIRLDVRDRAPLQGRRHGFFPAPCAERLLEATKDPPEQSQDPHHFPSRRIRSAPPSQPSASTGCVVPRRFPSMSLPP